MTAASLHPLSVVATYGGLLRIMSKRDSRTGSNHGPCRQQIPSMFIRCAFPRATFRATSLISVAVIAAVERSLAMASAMAPLPVPSSSTLAVDWD